MGRRARISGPEEALVRRPRRSSRATFACSIASAKVPQSTFHLNFDLEAAADQVIAACDGDVRAAVRALIVAKGLLEAELKSSTERDETVSPDEMLSAPSFAEKATGKVAF
jgi:hypothetical protein